jgi:hypothetical protein
MADAHEEQLLSDLLRTVAREDAHLGAAHLEARVLKACGEGPHIASGFSRTRLGSRAWRTVVAAGIASIVLPPAGMWLWRQPVQVVEVAKPAPTEVVVKAAPTPAVQPSAQSVRPIQRETVQPEVRREPATAPPVMEAPVAESTIEFVPLMPLTEQDLTGPFQIVRVQMPSASLGRLRSPLQHPSELVEADLLLGEDGTARAIRLSTSGSVYPWRPR